ncbi:DUF6035 family protein [Dyadobacter chenhuakuii]|uniref:DUF6035 family protein n=1 Tax=Dyadobacter chenhuakuii TaxID=2909339 RepID=A0A9X1QIE3_9BACT|nr:DUF6035 family protein [Dyadobacter chenhuakuii]MCF2501042.1 DUF6035 family protein [Dyadobacter chenhuakuii]
MAAKIPNRTIEEALDMQTGEIIEANSFFRLPESDLVRYRRIQQEAINGLGEPRFVCAFCKQILKISGTNHKRGAITHFAHLRDSEYCPIKTGSNYSREEIELRKYLGVKESERHIDLKQQIFNALKGSETKLGTEKIQQESRISSVSHWRRPDVYAEVSGIKIAFEIQLSNTFLSVVVARDAFYRANGIYIIWIFNFSKNTQYIDLESLMCKDIYYANKRNAFILDQEAQRMSIQNQELILLCIWWETTSIVDQNDSPDKLFRKYIRLSDLCYDPTNFKLFYKDCSVPLVNDEDKFMGNLPTESTPIQQFDRFEAILAGPVDRPHLVSVLEEQKRERIQNIMNQLANGTATLSPLEIDGKWGYGFEGEIVIEPIYTKVDFFKENGFAKVRLGEKYGFVNFKGEEIVPCIYDQTFEIYNGNLIARMGVIWSCRFIEQDLEEEIPYKWIKRLQQDLPLLLVSTSQKIFTESSSQSSTIEKSRLYGLMDFEGRYLLAPQFAYINRFINGVSEVEREGITMVANYNDGKVKIAYK